MIMITQLRLENFKSWCNTGAMRFAPLTAFFGKNSSGKTSILQFMVMMKQTVESSDQARILHTGDKNSYINLGTFYDIIHNHQIPGQIRFVVHWDSKRSFRIPSSDEGRHYKYLPSPQLCFEAVIEGDINSIQVVSFIYDVDDKYQFGMKRTDTDVYELTGQHKELELKQYRDRDGSPPYKSYIFPVIDLVTNQFVNSFEQRWKNISYLGPLREYPSRIYLWSGERPQDIGTRGEYAVSAMLASPEIIEHVARWLKKLGLIHSFEVRPIAKNRREHEVMIRMSTNSTEVNITDVGFGISQLLPVLVLCYYAPEHSIIILEQPEIHLHPSAQAGLADLFIEVINSRKVQIVLESHSEHLIRRLQRRIAEEQLQPEQTALYFTSIEDGVSNLEELDIDGFGNITNWPEDFFGDELGDLIAMTDAAMERSINGKSST